MIGRASLVALMVAYAAAAAGDPVPLYSQLKVSPDLALPLSAR